MRSLVTLLLLSLCLVPAYRGLRGGELSGRFWDVVRSRYVYRGAPEYNQALYQHKLLLVSLPLFFGMALLKATNP